MQIVSETKRLLFRRFSIDDAPFMLELNSDPEVMRYVHELPYDTLEKARALITDKIFPPYQKTDFGRWAIIEKETNELIGWCGLKYREERDEVDLGYRFLQRKWGKGYATESAAHSLKLGFDKYQLHCITGRAHVENIASLQVLKKIGMTYYKNEVVDNCPVETYRIFNSNRK